MLENILHRKFQEKYFDATDALAVALCHHFQAGSPLRSGKSYSGWSAFIKDNPGKIK